MQYPINLSLLLTNISYLLLTAIVSNTHDHPVILITNNITTVSVTNVSWDNFFLPITTSHNFVCHYWTFRVTSLSVKESQDLSQLGSIQI